MIQEIAEIARGHTPGPWSETTRGRDPFYITSNNGIVATAIVGYAATVAEAKANARLIAAAPDLLAALEGLLVGVYGGGYVLPAGAIATARARAAIAKARRLSQDTGVGG